MTSTEVRPPTYFNRKVGDKFIYRGVVHRVVAIHQKEREESIMVMNDSDQKDKRKLIRDVGITMILCVVLLLALLLVLGLTASAQCPTVATNQGYPKVTGIWLVDTRWNADLSHITDSVTVDVTGHSNLSLKAVIDSGGYPATEVNWDINATRPKVQFSRTDSDAPFTACGDVDVGGVPNIHRCFDLGPVGTYTVSATPRSGHCAG